MSQSGQMDQIRRFPCCLTLITYSVIVAIASFPHIFISTSWQSLPTELSTSSPSHCSYLLFLRHLCNIARALETLKCLSHLSYNYILHLASVIHTCGVSFHLHIEKIWNQQKCIHYLRMPPLTLYSRATCKEQNYCLCHSLQILISNNAPLPGLLLIEPECSQFHYLNHFGTLGFFCALFFLHKLFIF